MFIPFCSTVETFTRIICIFFTQNSKQSITQTYHNMYEAVKKNSHRNTYDLNQLNLKQVTNSIECVYVQHKSTGLITRSQIQSRTI